MMKNRTKYFLYLAVSLTFVSAGYGAQKRTETSVQNEMIQLNGRRFLPHKEGREFVIKNGKAEQVDKAMSRIPAKNRLVIGERSLEQLKKLNERIAQIEADSSHVILQLDEIPDRAKKQELKEAGIHLLEYLPGKAWLARVDKSQAHQVIQRKEIRWGDSLLIEDKVEQRIREKGVPSWAKKAGKIELIVSVFKGASMENVRTSLENMGVQVLLLNESMQSLTVSCSENDVDAIAELDAVRKVAAPPPPPTAYNSEARTQVTADQLQGIPNNLSGGTVSVGIWDGGLIASHSDFGARVVAVDSASGVSSHATHVAGTVGGSGQLSASQGGTALQWRGMAPSTTLLSFDWNFAGDDPTAEYENAINTYDLDLSQNSWGINMEIAGSDYYGVYISSCEFFDRFVRGELGRRIPICFAMGNDRDSTTAPPLGPGDYQCVAPPATAKNIISVGAVHINPTQMAPFSNVGPTADGRLKPEIVAPGVSVKSTIPGNSYQEMNGTSMATPVVSGVLALLMERTKNEFGDLRLLPSTYKALICHSAQDIQQPGPDYQSGFGLIQAEGTDELLRTRSFLEAALSDQAEEDTFKIMVTVEDAELKVTLAWDDYYGAALINNLDLELVEPSGTVHLPWVLDPENPSSNAVTGVDSINNIEQVYVANPVAGEWTIKVKGTTLPYEQSYSLVSGQLLSGGVNVQSLAVQNLGKSSLIVSNITTAATWIDLGNRSFTVPSGESRGVLVSILTASLPVGLHESSVAIYSNDPDTPVKNIPVSLTVSAANQPPVAPSEPVPQDGASGQPPEVGLSWVASDPDPEDTLTFDIYLGTTSGDLTLIRNGLSKDSTVFQYLAFDTNYYWQVVAKDSQGAATASPEWTFTSLSATGDADGDGLTNAQEREVGTNPYREDTDLDGYSDRYERMTGSDPLDYTSTPEALITVFYEDFNDGLLDDWYKTSALTANWQLQQSVQHSAPYALALTGGDDGSSGFYGEISSGLIQVDALGRYVLSGWIQGNGKLLVYEYDANGQLIAQTTSDLVNTSVFEQVRLVFEVGSQTASIRVVLVGLSDAPTYFDDLKLERAGSTILYFK